MNALAHLRGELGMEAPPPPVQFISFSCGFRQIILINIFYTIFRLNSRVCTPLPHRLGNHGSSTANNVFIKIAALYYHSESAEICMQTICAIDLYAVTDPGFLEGALTPLKPIILQNICQKLHENERI